MRGVVCACGNQTGDAQALKRDSVGGHLVLLTFGVSVCVFVFAGRVIFSSSLHKWLCEQLISRPDLVKVSVMQ